MRITWIGHVAISLAIAACAGTDGPELASEPVVAKTAQPLQLGNTGGVFLVDETISPIKYSVAALRLRNFNPTGPFGSCGLTWVSKHYGVTAAHCVTHLPIRQRSLTVEEIWVDGLDGNQLASYMTVSGNWNSGFQPGGTLTTGYGTLRYNDCYVSRRCSTKYGRQGCPIGEDVDIALIKCPSRTFPEHAETTKALLAYGYPENSDDLFEIDVNVWWFHEVYDLPTTDDNSDGWEHYGRYDGTGKENQNWHYTREHQLLPLVSHQFPNGGPLFRTVLPVVPDTNILNSMDTPICHGTSGSGVFVSGTNILLGPAISAGGDSDIFGKLCEPVADATPSERNTTYVSGEITARFVRLSGEVATDF